MKRLICWAIVLVMLLTALPAMADTVRISGDFQYTLKGNGTATIVGYTGEHTDIILPNQIDGYTVTTIGESAFSLEEPPMSSISVTLPNTTISIEAKAFANRNVFSINLPDAVEYIGYGAFMGCEAIQFRISNNHSCFATINGSLYNKLNKELIQWVKSDSSDDVIVPEGIVSIGDYAFANMHAVSIHLPETLKKIGNYAFWTFKCSNTLIVPASVSEIGAFAFAEALNDIDISNCAQLKTIPEGAFASTCDGFTDDIDHFLSSVRIEDLPQNIKTIDAYAFYECFMLEPTLTGVESIGPYAFSGMRTAGCVINIPETCKIVDEGAFYNVVGFGEINIAQGVERIESKAFSNSCSWLEKSIYLPSSLTYIALDAFDKEVTYIVEKGSYAERWAQDNAFIYTINGDKQNLDWLNN